MAIIDAARAGGLCSDWLPGICKYGDASSCREACNVCGACHCFGSECIGIKGGRPTV